MAVRLSKVDFVEMTDKSDIAYTSDPTLMTSNIKAIRDASVLTWFAADLTCRFAEDPTSVADQVAEILAFRFQRLEADFGRPLPPAAQEAASVLLSLLLELSQARSEVKSHVSRLLMYDGFLETLLSVMQPVSTEASSKGEADDSRGGAAFAYACHLLAFESSEDGELRKVLRRAGVIDLVSQRLLEAGDLHSHELNTDWHSLATAAMNILQVLVLREDPGDPISVTGYSGNVGEETLTGRMHRFLALGLNPCGNAQVLVAACLGALERSLLRDGGSMVIHQLHLSGMRIVGHLAHLSVDQARHALTSNGVAIGAAVLAVAGADEEAVGTALWYLAEIAASSPALAQQQLVLHHVSSFASKALSRYQHVEAVKKEATRVLSACGALASTVSPRRRRT